MIRSFLLLSIGAALYASSDYIPFSKFSQNEQIEYNFRKAEINNSERIDEVRQIKKVPIRNYKKPTATNITRKIEIRKPIKQESKKATEITESKVIEKKQKEKTLKKTRYKQDILYSARLSFSPLTADYSSSLGNTSDKSNSIEPSGSVSFGDHKIEANYFKSENDFSSTNVETTWYKLAYKHKYRNANIGMGINHLSIDSTLSDEKEIFPSVEVDLKNTSELMDVEYGASVGKNDNIDYAYEYFINLNIKPKENSNQALVVGYKSRTIERNDEKFEFNGPFIGINTKF